MSQIKFSIIKRAAIWAANNKRCIYCDEVILFKDLNIDHIIPETKLEDAIELRKILEEYELPETFQINSYYNLVSSHASCNKKKGNILFKKNRALFFLEIAARNFSKVLEHEKLYKDKFEKDKLLVSIAIGLEKGIISKEEISEFPIETRENKFKIYDKLEFEEKIIIDSVWKEDISELLDLKVKLGANNFIGVTLVNDDNDKITVYTCREYKEAISNGYYALTTFDMKMASFFNKTCGIVSALQNATLPIISYIENPRVGIVDLDLLPITILHDLSGERYISDSISIQDYIDKNLVRILSIKQSSIRLEHDEGCQIFIELMRADFNNDGIEELLVYTYLYSLEGTFGYGDVIILSRKDNKSLFSLEKT